MGDIPVHDSRDVHLIDPTDPTRKVSVILDGTTERLAVDAGNVSTVSGLFFPGNYQNKQLELSGSPNMNVDGSVSSKSFIAEPAALKIFYVSRLILFMEDQSMNHTKYAGITGGITNGIEIKVTESGSERLFHPAFKTNADFYNVAHDIDIASASTDIFTMRWSFHQSGTWLELKDSTSDNLKIVVQDDLTSINAFRAVVQGFEVTE